MSEEFGDRYGGQANFLKLYKVASKRKYGFLYLDLQSNPSKAYSGFNDLIYENNTETEGDGWIKNIHKEAPIFWFMSIVHFDAASGIFFL